MRSAWSLLLALTTVGACVYDWTVPAETQSDDDNSQPQSSSLSSGATGGAGGSPGSGGSPAGIGGAQSGGQGGELPIECQPNGGDNSCEACVKADCCSELLACYDDPDCECWLDCLSYGGDCLARCGAPSPATQDFLFCTQAECPSC